MNLVKLYNKQAVDWTSEDKAAGVARMHTLSDKLGGWKSSEYKSSVAREVLSEKISSRAYDSYMLLCEAIQMLYSKELQMNGWQEDHIERLEKLLWAHVIKAEEFYGLSFCTENLEYSIHAGSDNHRHSSMDNYSCELFERVILTHKGQKHNAKGLEKTFVTRENIRHFLNDYEESNGNFSLYDHQKVSYKFDIEASGSSPFYLNESSCDAARALYEDLQDHKHLPAINHALSYGIAIGAIKKKGYPPEIISDLKRFFNRQQIQVNAIPNVLNTIKCLVTAGEHGSMVTITKGNICKVASTLFEQEWIMTVEDIFMIGPINDNYYTFVNGTYYIPLLSNGSVSNHEWTKTPKLIRRMYIRDSIQSTINIKRKVIIYPEPSNIQNPSYFLCIEPTKPDLSGQVSVPVYPKVQDNLCVKGPGREIWYGRVQHVAKEARQLTVKWYTETRRQGVWCLTSQEDVINFSSVISLCTVNRIFGGYSISS